LGCAADQGERITRLLARWRKYQGVAASAEKLIKALRTNDVEEIELAHLIEREIGKNGLGRNGLLGITSSVRQPVTVEQPEYETVAC